MYINIDNVNSIHNALCESSDAECSICLENLNSKYTILKCNHVFHTQCIKKWLKNHMECPMCRKYLKEYYSGSVYYKSKIKLGTKFNLILNDDKFIIKYFYKFTNIIKKRAEIPITKIKYFSHTGQFFVYHYLDYETHKIKQETLFLHNNGAPHLFSQLKEKINIMIEQTNNENHSNVSYL